MFNRNKFLDVVKYKLVFTTVDGKENTKTISGYVENGWECNFDNVRFLTNDNNETYPIDKVLVIKIEIIDRAKITYKNGWFKYSTYLLTDEYVENHRMYNGGK